jgi:hypothetical protein
MLLIPVSAAPAKQFSIGVDQGVRELAAVLTYPPDYLPALLEVDAISMHLHQIA